MSRRSRLRTLLAGTLALLLVACGDDGPPAASTPGAGAGTDPSTSAEIPAPHPIEFVKGLAAGREAAGDANALLFVYVARHQPT